MRSPIAIHYRVHERVGLTPHVTHLELRPTRCTYAGPLTLCGTVWTVILLPVVSISTQATSRPALTTALAARVTSRSRKLAGPRDIRRDPAPTQDVPLPPLPFGIRCDNAAPLPWGCFAIAIAYTNSNRYTDHCSLLSFFGRSRPARWGRLFLRTPSELRT
jgi:hypothetical protein